MPDGAPDTAGFVESFWAGRLGPGGALLGAVLAPVELTMRGVVAARNRAYDMGLLPSRSAAVAAVSVGNLTVGGTGKTPLVRWLVRHLLSQGRTPGILHGGYADDEPALLAYWFPELPVVARKDRVEGGREAVAAGADVLVLDDAFQHRRMRRDLDLVLVPLDGIGRRARLLPRGPYREPPRALLRADAIILTRRTGSRAEARAAAEAIRHQLDRPVVVAHLAADRWLDRRGGERPGSPGPAAGVTAIGRPDAFYRQAERSGARLQSVHTFRDHHTYTPAELESIAGVAAGRPVVTTAKDAVKLAALPGDIELWVLDQRVVFDEGEDALLRTVQEVL